MRRYSGIHTGIHGILENRSMLGKELDFCVPGDGRMRDGDYVLTRLRAPSANPGMR